MPRGKPGKLGLAEDGHGNLAPVRIDGDSDRVPAVPGVQKGPDRAEAANEAFLWLLSRDDGWLRVAGGSLAKTNYYKWKFSRGEHKGHYVMYVGNVGDWVGGILGLAEKLNEVDNGLRRPAYDTPYDYQ